MKPRMAKPFSRRSRTAMPTRRSSWPRNRVRGSSIIAATTVRPRSTSSPASANWTGSGSCSSRGADPNIGDGKGDTPLIIAVARSASRKRATTLLGAERKVDAANRRGETALDRRGPAAAAAAGRAAAEGRRQSRQGRSCRRLYAPRLCQARHAQPANAEADRDHQVDQEAGHRAQASTRSRRPAKGRSARTVAAPRGVRSAAFPPCAVPVPAAASTVPA